MDQPDHFRVLVGVGLRDLRRTIGAAIVDQYVLEILEGLVQNTLDALGEKIAGVVKRSYHAYQRTAFAERDVAIRVFHRYFPFKVDTRPISRKAFERALLSSANVF
jgi:hypothetical protein